jgi:hypothetical protein
LCEGLAQLVTVVASTSAVDDDVQHRAIAPVREAAG